MSAKVYFALIAAMLLTGCAGLTANAPLFTPADQVGPAPLTEGIWIHINEHCPARNAQRRGQLPDVCYPAELRRDADGAWTFAFQDHVRSNPEVDLPDDSPRAWRLIIAPAAEHPTIDAYVSLYLAENTPLDSKEEQEIHYAVIAPVGPLPAREMYLVAQIGCIEILRDGPIEGVTEARDENGNITSCVASSQAAVREAARRAVIEHLSEMLSGSPSAHLLYVRPAAPQR